MENETRPYNGMPLHIGAIVLWVLIWLALAFVVNPMLNLFSSKYWVLYLFPFALGISHLAINAHLTKNSQPGPSYEEESRIIEFVERNASWFLLASAALYGWATFASSPGAHFEKTPFVVFAALSSILVTPTILLWWIPSEQKRRRDLMILRIVKTIPFSYAVAFFTAAIITLMIGALPP